MITVQEFQDMLQNAIEDQADAEDSRVSITTFDEAGVLSRNAGLVVRLPGADWDDAQEFQITIVETGG